MFKRDVLEKRFTITASKKENPFKWWLINHSYMRYLPCDGGGSCSLEIAPGMRTNWVRSASRVRLRNIHFRISSMNSKWMNSVSGLKTLHLVPFLKSRVQQCNDDIILLLTWLGADISPGPRQVTSWLRSPGWRSRRPVSRCHWRRRE